MQELGRSFWLETRLTCTATLKLAQKSHISFTRHSLTLMHEPRQLIVKPARDHTRPGAPNAVGMYGGRERDGGVTVLRPKTIWVLLGTIEVLFGVQ
jgi:hypothetical protein